MFLEYKEANCQKHIRTITHFSNLIYLSKNISPKEPTYQKNLIFKYLRPRYKTVEKASSRETRFKTAFYPLKSDTITPDNTCVDTAIFKYIVNKMANTLYHICSE